MDRLQRSDAHPRISHRRDRSEDWLEYLRPPAAAVDRRPAHGNHRGHAQPAGAGLCDGPRAGTPSPADQRSAGRARRRKLHFLGWPFVTCHLSCVGIDVKDVSRNLNPRTATFPLVTVNSAVPRLPTVLPKPGRSRKAIATLPFAGIETRAGLPSDLP